MCIAFPFTTRAWDVRRGFQPLASAVQPTMIRLEAGANIRSISATRFEFCFMPVAPSSLSKLTHN